VSDGALGSEMDEVGDDDVVDRGEEVVVEPGAEEGKDPQLDRRNLVFLPERKLLRAEGESTGRLEVESSNDLLEDVERGREEAKGEEEGRREGRVDHGVVGGHLLDQDGKRSADDDAVGIVGDLRGMVAAADEPNARLCERHGPRVYDGPVDSAAKRGVRPFGRGGLSHGDRQSGERVRVGSGAKLRTVEILLYGVRDDIRGGLVDIEVVEVGRDVGGRSDLNGGGEERVGAAIE
jgi:hypothetical protein